MKTDRTYDASLDLSKLMLQNSSFIIQKS